MEVEPSTAFCGIPPSMTELCIGALPAATFKTETEKNKCLIKQAKDCCLDIFWQVLTLVQSIYLIKIHSSFQLGLLVSWKLVIWNFSITKNKDTKWLFGMISFLKIVFLHSKSCNNFFMHCWFEKKTTMDFFPHSSNAEQQRKTPLLLMEIKLIRWKNI